MTTLWVVATPIGNLEDVTLRALRVLGEVGAIAAEDTRVTSRLLARHGIRKTLMLFRQLAKEGRLDTSDLDAPAPPVAAKGDEP